MTDTSNASATDVTVQNASTGIVLFRVTDSDFNGVRLEQISLIGVDAQQSRRLSFVNLHANGTWGLWARSTSDVNLEGATVSAFWGIRIWSFASNWSMANLSLTNVTATGVDLFDAVNVSISNATVGPGDGSGIDIVACFNVTIRGLLATGIDTAVYVDGSQAVSVVESFFFGGGTGVAGVNAGNLRIASNTFLDLNGSAFFFQDVRVSTVTQNNLIGGPFLAYSSGGGGNAWDDFGIGNFWYPHNYTDADGDLVGDSPYNISGGAEADMFPRMFAWTSALPWASLAGPLLTPQDVDFAVQYAGGDFLGHPSFSLNVSGNGTAQFVDGSTARVRLSNVGMQTVTLTVTNLGGLAVQRTVIVQVLDTEAPRVALAGPSSVPAGIGAVYDPSGTTDNDPTFPAGLTVDWSITDVFGGVTTFAAALAPISFVPDAVGVYQISLVVRDASGNTNTTAIQLFATDAATPLLFPIAGRTLAEDLPASFGPPMLIDDDPAINVTGSFEWRFVRGADPPVVAAVRSPTLTFAGPGRYNVTLTVCDAALRCANTSFQVAVTDTTPPDLSGIGPLLVNASRASVLTAAAATDNDPDWPIGADLVWTIQAPDGDFSVSGFFVLVTIAQPGTYGALLAATDGAGNRASIALQIIAIDVDPPEVRIDHPTVVEVGEVVTFSAANSTDPSSPLNITWEFGDGSPGGAGLDVTHAFPGVANVLVRVTVRDAAGNSNMTTIPVRVVDTRAPEVELWLPSLGNGGARANVGEVVRFEVRIRDPSDGVIVTWDFGDGQSDLGIATNHTFSSSGVKTIRVTATDHSGNSNVTAFDLVVDGPPNADPWVAWPVTLAIVAGTIAVVAFSWARRSRHH